MKHGTGFVPREETGKVSGDGCFCAWLSVDIASFLRDCFIIKSDTLWDFYLWRRSKVNSLCLFSVERIEKKGFRKWTSHLLLAASRVATSVWDSLSLPFNEAYFHPPWSKYVIKLRFFCVPLPKNPTIIQTAMRVSLCTLPNVMQIWRKHEIEILYEMSITLKERTLYSYENRGITNRISLNIQCVFFIEATQTASKADLRLFQHQGDGNRV